ncbi:MAG: hypothetical protein HY951_10010 [Bacteroidia bacterium]|nr:hypothetical protein [Bacteroidia bacterium]
MKTLINLKPGVSKRYLLFVAAIVWSFAGFKLNSIGFVLFHHIPGIFAYKLAGCIILGVLFFILMFKKLSKKHIIRIINLPSERPFILFFFNLRSYILMTVMMTSGILTRKYELLPKEYIAVIYVVMGLPLLLSSLRFYYYGFYYNKYSEILKEK